MLHHHPPIPPQIHSITSPLYPPTPHIHPSPHIHSPPHIIPQTVSSSYLPSATSLYATLLQPLSIQLLHSFPQPHTQAPSSIFGHAQVYPARPILILVQSSPHVPTELVHVLLQAPSQQALCNFWAQCELLLPGTGNPIEPTENGERCAVRDLDGNLIEVYWSAHHSEGGNRYVVEDSLFSRSPHAKRDRERRSEAIPQRTRDRERDPEVERKREKVREKARNTDVDMDRNLDRGENLDGQREKDRERIKYIDRGQIKRRTKREEDSVAVDVMITSNPKPSDKKTRRVLQWQKNVADSINHRRDDSHSEDYDESEQSEDSENPDNYEQSEDAWESEESRQFQKLDDIDEYAYSDDQRPRSGYRKSHSYSGISLIKPQEKGRPLEYVNKTFRRADTYPVHGRDEREVLKSHKQYNKLRRESERNLSEYYEAPFSGHSKRIDDKRSWGDRNQYLSNSRSGCMADEAEVCESLSSSPESSLLRTTLKRNTLRSKSPKISLAHYDHRRRKHENDRTFLDQSGRRDSGIAGIFGIGGSEKDRAYLHPISSERDLAATNLTRRETDLSFHRRFPESNRLHEERISSNRSKSKHRFNNSDSGIKYPSSPNSSASVSDIESFISYTSDPEPYYKPKISRTATDKRIERMKRMIKEDSGHGYSAGDLESRPKERLRGGRRRQDSNLGPSHHIRSRSSDYKSYSHPSHTISVLSQCPSSFSGSTMRAEGEMLAKVPTPPSAISPGSRLKGRKSMVGSKDHKSYRENAKSTRTVNYKYKRTTLPEWSYQKEPQYENSPDDHYRGSRRNGMRDTYPSRSEREYSRPPSSTSYGYVHSDSSSESVSSIDKRERDRGGKTSHRKRR